MGKKKGAKSNANDAEDNAGSPSQQQPPKQAQPRSQPQQQQPPKQAQPQSPKQAQPQSQQQPPKQAQSQSPKETQQQPKQPQQQPQQPKAKQTQSQPQQSSKSTSAATSSSGQKQSSPSQPQAQPQQSTKKGGKSVSTASEIPKASAKMASPHSDKGEKKGEKKAKKNEPPFPSLQKSQEEIEALIEARAARSFLSPEFIDIGLNDSVIVHLFGTAAPLAPEGKIEVPIGPMDSSLFLMMRIEKMIRVPIEYWGLFLMTKYADGQQKPTPLSGGELIGNMGLGKNDDRHQKIGTEVSLYLIPSNSTDIEAFKKFLGTCLEQNNAIKKSKPKFFNTADFPAELDTWEKKAVHAFKLTRHHASHQEEKKDEDMNVDGGDDDEEDESEKQGPLRIESDSEDEKEPKIMEIEDDADLERLDREEKERKQERRKKKEAEKVKKADDIWEKFFENRIKELDELEEELDNERDQFGEDDSAVIFSLFKNVDAILNETALTQEQKDLIKHNIIPVAVNPEYEDGPDDLRLLSADTRIYSLVDNSCVDLQFTYHHRTRNSSIEFHAAIGYMIQSPLTEFEFADIFSKYSFHRVPGSSGWKVMFYNFLDDDRRVKEFVYKERKDFLMTRKNLIQIRKTLFGHLKEISDKISDLQLTKLLLASAAVNYGMPNGPTTRLALGDYFGYHMRLMCKAALPHDDDFEEHNFEDDVIRQRKMERDDEEDYDDEDGEGYDSDEDDDEEYGYDDEDAEFDPRQACQPQ